MIIPPLKQWKSPGMHQFVKHTIKKYMEADDDVNLDLLQINSTPKGTGLASPATLLFNRSMSKIRRTPFNHDYDECSQNKLQTAKVS